jgi:segregation and condensation protein A
MKINGGIAVSYSVKLDSFEGPLDLLLHLINRFEIDIYDIPVAKITDQYLSYVHAMKELQLDIASEYLVMAATLLQIKSRMLLPKQEDELLDEELQFDPDEEDPREDLMQRLLEYRKYKEVAKELQKCEEERSQVYTRPPQSLNDYKQEQKHTLSANVTLYDMLGAFQKLLRRKKLSEPLTSTVQRQEIKLEYRMVEILDELRQNNGKKSFYSLFPYADRGHIVVTFLAILELMKANEIDCEQNRNFEDITILIVEGGVASES